MKDYKNFTTTVLAIIILSFTTYWQYGRFNNQSFEFETPELEMPDFNIGSGQQEINEKEFISPDNKLKLTYSSQWTEMPKEQLAQSMGQTIQTNSVILLSAQRFDLTKASFAILIVQELDSTKSATTSADNTQAIIELMKKETEGKKGNMEITYATGTDKELLFEAEYKKDDVALFRSKERIIIDEKTYLISFIASAKDWSDFEPEAQRILSSVQIIK